MGAGRWDADSRATYDSFTADSAAKSTEEIYDSRGLKDHLNPKGVKVRESRDSAENPESTPIIVGLDVTGSMGMLADTIARQGLGTLFESILKHKPVTDPHIMFMGIGDANCDRAPLQVSQFEADAVIIQQLTDLWLEKGGGGNHFESYNLPWYFAAFHTSHDAMERRGKRGYLFTVGDEEAPGPLTRGQIHDFIGDDIQADLSSEDLLAYARRVYDVYHIVIAEGYYASSHLDRVRASWSNLIGQHMIVLQDHTKLAETIVGAIQVAEGRDISTDWADDTRRVVGDAVKHLPGPAAP